MYSKLDYFIDTTNITQSLIIDIINKDYLSFLNNDKNFLNHIFSIAHFILAKEYFIKKDKADTTINRLKSQIPNPNWSEIINTLPNFDYQPNSLQPIELIDRIRDSIMHCTAEYNFDSQTIVINNTKPGRELQATIPFVWFYQFFERDNYKDVETKDYTFNMCMLDESCPTYIAVNKRNINSILDNFKFVKMNIKSQTPFSVLKVREIIMSILSIRTYSYPLQIQDPEQVRLEADRAERIRNQIESNPKLDADQLYLLEIIRDELKYKHQLDFEYEFLEVEKEELKEYLDIKENENIPISNVLHLLKKLTIAEDLTAEFLRQIISCFKQISEQDITKYPKELLDKLTDERTEYSDCWIILEEYFESLNITVTDPHQYFDVLNEPILNAYQYIKSNPKHIIEALLYTCFINCFNVNKETFDLIDSSNILIPEGLTAYTTSEYNIQNSRQTPLLKQLREKQRILTEKQSIYTNHPTANLRNAIEILQNEIADIQARLNTLTINDQNNIININGRKLATISSKEETMKIIRNCFSHLGRVKIEYNCEGTLTLSDYSDNHKVTAQIKTDLASIFEFITQQAFLEALVPQPFFVP